jgi:hypothetical protein
VNEQKPVTHTLHAVGVARMHDNDRAILVMLERRPTDDELRDLHESLGSPRRQQSGAINEGRDNSTAPLIPSQSQAKDDAGSHVSHTPRTDAMEAQLAKTDCCFVIEPEFPTLINFARQLERELALWRSACKSLDEGLKELRLTQIRPDVGAMKFETHCPDGQMCGATTTGCLEGQCQRKEAERCSCASFSLIPCPVHGNRDPRQSQPECHSCGGWVKVEEGGICLPCHTESK